ncbi:GNAT family N-acetyltransferase [Chitinophaga lutea]|uniref:GNAT family N-acetyltransferase n=1 Tax=Chitinophaga lutea TaxID=2488634 RepID=A0A3N4PZY4_9BACT|nr:GNAT family N-acetyltransferase [Chitinophaga lutea]RPE12955.1 GNAT family N-acetyltransferase [Chitinophaga lutea]
MIIRPYTPADKPGCISAFESNMPRFFAPAELEDYSRWLDGLAIRDEPEAGIDNYFVAENDGRVIGCGGFYLDREKQEATMAWGLISNEHHKKGWGKELFMYRLNVIRSLCARCRVILDTTQHSFPFFEKIGFNVVKITKDFYGEGLDRYDMELLPATEQSESAS